MAQHQVCPLHIARHSSPAHMGAHMGMHAVSVQTGSESALASVAEMPKAARTVQLAQMAAMAGERGRLRCRPNGRKPTSPPPFCSPQGFRGG